MKHRKYRLVKCSPVSDEVVDGMPARTMTAFAADGSVLTHAGYYLPYERYRLVPPDYLCDRGCKPVPPAREETHMKQTFLPIFAIAAVVAGPLMAPSAGETGHHRPPTPAGSGGAQSR